MRPDFWFSNELQATVRVPEWGNRPVEFRQEEEVRDGHRRWLATRTNL